jgi:hypothetical protein
MCRERFCKGNLAVALRIVAFILLALDLVVALDGRQAQAAGAFDGTWNVILVCGNDPKSGAHGYRYDFTAQVTNSTLHGEHGDRGHPGWLAIDGTINGDGTAYLSAVGLTGEPRATVGYVHQGTPYAYHVNARFEGASGSGSRIELRACSYAFTRQ